MKTLILILLVIAMASTAAMVSAQSQVAQCPDGRWYPSGTCTRCPDGQYTSAPACQRTPTGDWIADYGKGLRLAPDGRWIPDGAGVIQCPDGRWHAGKQCVLLPDQRWTGTAEVPAR